MTVPEEMIEESNKKAEQVNIYAYYDKKSDKYDIPFFAKDDIQAMRKFKLDTIANDGQSIIGQFKDDFRLYRIGMYDIKEGYLYQKSLEVVMHGKDITNA